MNNKTTIIKTAKYALDSTLPILVSFIFIGIAFGMMLQSEGYNFIWAFFISLFVYAGSMQFVLITFLNGSVDILTVILTTLMVNGRHMFYGISFIEKYKEMDKLYPYMVFSLTDETYSLLCSANIPPELDKKYAQFFISSFSHCYLIIGSVIGGLAGQYIKFNSEGIDFAMTALFVVIFIEQWKSFKNHIPAVCGVCFSVISLIIFGSENFLLPALFSCVILLMILKSKINIQEVAENE